MKTALGYSRIGAFLSGLRMVSSLLTMTVALCAQPGTTPIRDTVYSQFGQPYTGSVTVSLSTPGATGQSAPILSLVTRQTITAGALSVNLVPNDTMTPTGSSYVFVFGNGARKTCVVPTSNSNQTLAGMGCTDAAPASVTPQVPLSWLSGGGLSAGTYCIVVSNTGQVSLTQSGCPGSGGGFSWSGMTSGGWSGMTSGQWGGLVP